MSGRRSIVSEDPASLELDREHMLALGQWAVAHITEHIEALADAPACGDMDAAALCRQLVEPPPEQGVDDWQQLLSQLMEEWVPRSYNTAGPGYLAYVPGGGLFPSAIADFIADGVNRYTGVWNASPALLQLEANVLEWFRSWMGFPDTARGVLTTGGSMATLGAIVTAREHHLGTRLRDGVLYASTQAHHCVAKAAKMAGILSDRVRAIPVDEEQRLRIDALENAIRLDRASGLLPFAVASAAGTVNTGAIDPLADVAELCEREGLWHHVDGAYGGFFHLCDELKPSLVGLSRADSLALDPHKGLFLPYGTGALLVRNGELLRAAHAVSAEYLPPTAREEVYDPCQLGPELSRDYRGLRVWLPLKLFGAARFRAALSEKRALALEAAEQLEQVPGIRVVRKPDLSLFAFALEPHGSDLVQQNAATEALLEGVLARNRVMLTGTAIDAAAGQRRFVARMCVLCFRTRRRHVEHAVEDIALSARAILNARSS